MQFLRVGVSPREGLLAVGAGLLGAAAFPPLGLWPLSLLSIAFFLRLLRDRNPSDARNLGLLYGFVYGLATMYWLFSIFGVLAISLIAIMAGYFGLLGTLIGMARGHSHLPRILLIALFAVAIEWLRGDAWYLRFPWYTAPHALAAAPACIAPVRWLGTYGFSFAIWLIAATGANGRAWNWAGFLVLPMFALFLPAVTAPDRRAILIQAEGTHQVEALISQIPTQVVDLAVLPEYAYFSSPERAIASEKGPAALARRLSSPVIFGAVEGSYGTRQFQNVAAVIDADGNLLGTFPKQRPVPLFLDGSAGNRRPVFALDQGTVGIAICYDFDAPEIAAFLVHGGATVLVAPTFDAMSWSRTQHDHHELLLRLRAVENDRWILRAASSGRSEAVNPRGQPSQEGVGVGESGFVTVGYAHRSGTPLGGQAHILGPAAAALTILVLLTYAGRFWRSHSLRQSPGPGPAAPTQAAAPLPGTVASAANLGIIQTCHALRFLPGSALPLQRW